MWCLLLAGLLLVAVMGAKVEAGRRLQITPEECRDGPCARWESKPGLRVVHGKVRLSGSSAAVDRAARGLRGASHVPQFVTY